MVQHRNGVRHVGDAGAHDEDRREDRADDESALRDALWCDRGVHWRREDMPEHEIDASPVDLPHREPFGFLNFRQPALAAGGPLGPPHQEPSAREPVREEKDCEARLDHLQNQDRPVHAELHEQILNASADLAGLQKPDHAKDPDPGHAQGDAIEDDEGEVEREPPRPVVACDALSLQDDGPVPGVESCIELHGGIGNPVGELGEPCPKVWLEAPCERHGKHDGVEEDDQHAGEAPEVDEHA
mmetsp:Transcript_25833/g.74398  ORF Transcript_25833/g.74398 Transcript_25833/m.74398 type:complete len:242 (-) Transcript_25833:747-1472(-)